MVRIDMKNLPAGAYEACVDRAELTTSKSGSPMLKVELVRADTGQPLCRDWIVLAGTAWDAFGKSKLEALGIPPDFDGDLEPDDLVGRRVRVHVIEKEVNGRTYLNVDTDQGEFKGYDRLDRADAASDEDAPF